MNKEQARKFLELFTDKVPKAQTRTGWVTSNCPFAPWRHQTGVSTSQVFGVKIEHGDSFANCLAGETRVLTWDGLKPIRDLAGGTHRILTKGGAWVDAPFKSYGVQPLLKVTLQLNGVRRVEYATAGHRWFVRQGLERTTADLRPGHRLEAVLPAAAVPAPSDPGVRHGLVFGDGSASRGYAVINLYGECRKLAPLFCGYTVTEKADHTNVYIGREGASWKSLPARTLDPSYLSGFVSGWVAADGYVNANGNLTLASATREHLEWLRDIGPRIGLALHPITVQHRRGYAAEATPLYTVTFVRSRIPEGWLVKADQVARLKPAKFDRLRWTVVSVEESARVEEVFCAEVPGTHSFALEGNLLTGNCWSCGWKGHLSGLVLELRHLNTADPRGVFDFKAGLQLIADAEASFDLDLDFPDFDEALAAPGLHEFPGWWIDAFPGWREAKAACAYLEERRVHPSIADALDLRYDPNEHRICFPVRDGNEVLRGLHGRALLPAIEPRYRMYTQAKRNNPDVWLGEAWVDLDRPVLIVEGPFDLASALRVYRNTVCPLFPSISERKFKRMGGATEYVTLYDHGTGGDNGRKRIDELAHHAVRTHLKPPHGTKDPGDMSIMDLVDTLEGTLPLDEIVDW